MKPEHFIRMCIGILTLKMLLIACVFHLKNAEKVSNILRNFSLNALKYIFNSLLSIF